MCMGGGFACVHVCVCVCEFVRGRGSVRQEYGPCVNGCVYIPRTIGVYGRNYMGVYQRITMLIHECTGVCSYACVCMCVCLCVYMNVRVCLRGRTRMYDTRQRTSYV